VPDDSLLWGASCNGPCDCNFLEAVVEDRRQRGLIGAVFIPENADQLRKTIIRGGAARLAYVALGFHSLCSGIPLVAGPVDDVGLRRERSFALEKRR